MPACVGIVYKTLGPSSLFDNSDTNDIRRSPNSDCAISGVSASPDTVLGVDRSLGDKVCVVTTVLHPGNSALCPEYAGGAMPSFPSIITVGVPGILS